MNQNQRIKAFVDRWAPVDADGGYLRAAFIADLLQLFGFEAVPAIQSRTIPQEPNEGPQGGGFCG